MNESSAASFLSTGAAASVILVAAALALPATLLALWLYRRSVAAAMRASSGRPRAAPAPNPPIAPGPRPPLALRVIEGTTADAYPTALEALVGSRLRATLVVYAAAGFAYAVFEGVLWLVAGGMELLPIRTTVVIWVHLWPLMMAANLLLVPKLRTQAHAFLAYLAIPVALAPAYAMDGSLIVLLAISMGVPTVLLAAFLHSRLRAAGPLVLAFMLMAATGAHLTAALLATGPGMHFIVNTAVALNMDVLELFWSWQLGAFVVFGLLGWLALAWIRRRYEAKRISDQSLMLDAMWLIYTVLAALQLANEGWSWSLAGLGGFVVYKSVTVAGFALLRSRRSAEPNRKLLLLRVFGSQDRSERLFARAGARWRYAGSIQLIAGTDLATANLEPHEFLDFVRGALRERYIGDERQLERQLDELDLAPDADGRYRVNEFFCRDDTWKATLGRLARTSDVVLMDLRGFGRENQGCIFELNELVAAVPLDRITLVVDDTTDLALLREVLDHAWADLRAGSPNAHRARPEIALLRVGKDDPAASRAIVAALAGAAARADAAQFSSKALATSS